ncbi:TIGR02611 family protein [Kineococcus glutinatus]|uniref:TIGR02611 family protein n=1 Tax=Kineococcus glutinatus TaxID=1070872 RepID=A0ABP9H7Q3_9ACTN
MERTSPASQPPAPGTGERPAREATPWEPGSQPPAAAAARPGPGREAVSPGGHRWRRWRAGLHARRERIRADAHANRLWRAVVAVAGSAVAAVGLVLVPLPGPGWLIVLVGLAILGSEFHWARRAHRFARRRIQAWTAWVGRRSWSTRVLLGGATAAALVTVAWGWLAWQGLPPWVPVAVTAELRRVPGLD